MSVTGIDLDPLRPACIHGDGATPAPTDFPAAVLRPTVRRGPLRLDANWPASPEGTGLLGEPQPELQRLPLAHAWSLLLQGKTETWPTELDRHSQIRVASALGFAAGQICASGIGADLAAVVVPDGLEEDAQDDLLRELRHQQGRTRGGARKTELLWRSVAAGLAWIEAHREELPLDIAKHHRPIGDLIHFHFGLDSFEASTLALVPHEEGGRTWLLPGRRGPSSRHLLPTVPAQTARAVMDSCLDLPATSMWTPLAWNALWVSPLLQLALGGSTDHELPGWLPKGLVGRFRERLAAAFLGGKSRSGSVLPPVVRGYQDQIREWRRNVSEPDELRGVVITGALAALPMEHGCTLGESVARGLGSGNLPVWIEARDQECMLSRGAHLYATRRVQDEPTYLDTLPQVSLIVMQMGEPIWTDLLATTWVTGGRTWHSANLTHFQIDRGHSDLELTVHRAAAPTCRRVRATLERTLEQDCPVSLSVEIEPGQGQPRVSLTPEDESLLKGRALMLDWGTAKDTGCSPEEELDKVERVCPPLEPRLASRKKWNMRMFPSLEDTSFEGIRSLVIDYASYERFAWPRRSQYGTQGKPREALPLLHDVLREQVAMSDGRIGTAVSSDGRVPQGREADQRYLDAFIQALDEKLHRESGDGQLHAIKVLGSVSAHSENLLALLRNYVRSEPSGIKRWRAVIWACGNCLRLDADVEAFFSMFEKMRIDQWAALAVANVMMYRERAPMLISSQLATSLVQELAPQLRTQVLSGNHYPIRYCGTAVAYLLRRRIADPSFLAPGTAAHTEINNAVKYTLNAEIPYRTPGVDRILAALRMILAYLDRKGRGRPTALLLDDKTDTE